MADTVRLLSLPEGTNEVHNANGQGLWMFLLRFMNRLPLATTSERTLFRWIAVDSGRAALALERRLQRGEAACGKPLLNPSFTMNGQKADF